MYDNYEFEIDSKLPCWMQELFKLVEDAKKENQHKVSTRANKMSVMLMKITDNQIIDLAKSQKGVTAIQLVKYYGLNHSTARSRLRSLSKVECYFQIKIMFVDYMGITICLKFQNTMKYLKQVKNSKF
jgi:ribosomal protein S25